MKEPEPFTAISFVSGKGGVGKTIMAINAACEIAKDANVLLVDFDLFNFGLTLQFRETLCSSANTDDRLLTLAELYASYDLSDNWQDRMRQSIKTRNLVRIVYPSGEPHLVSGIPRIVTKAEDLRLFILPCFIPNTVSQTQLTNALQPSGSPPKGPGDLVKLLDFAMKVIREQYQINFVVFDCHPGVVGYSSPCCVISNCNVLVSDFDRSSLLSSVIFTALIERNLQGLKVAELSRKPQRIWRVVVNRVPSWRQFGECQTRLEEAIRQAQNPDIKVFFKQLSLTMIKDFTAPLTTIPDLEELRDPRLDAMHELSPARRGGNGLILATKEMLRNMARSIKSLQRFPFYKQDERVTTAFAALKSTYYLDRGLGRSGITRGMLVITLLNVICAGWLLLGAAPEVEFIAIAAEALLILMFGTALYEMARQNRQSRRCFDIFSAISGFGTHNYSPAQRHRLYNAGGSPATTSAIWFPKAVWFLCCSLGLAVAVAKGHFVDFLVAWKGIVGVSIVGSIITYITLWEYQRETPSGIRKDVEFFVFSLLVAVGLIKGGELTKYY